MKVNWEALINICADLGIDLRQWRESVDNVSDSAGEEDAKKEFVTQCITIYADPKGKATIESFDDEGGTLRNALKHAK